MSTSPVSPSGINTTRGWRVWVAWFIVALFTIEVLTALFVTRGDKSFATSEFAKVPLIFNGRVQPMDSLARNSLIQIRGITEVPLEGNGAAGAWGAWEELRDKGGELHERAWYQFSKRPAKLKPAEWLLELFCDPKKADDRYVFVINHPDLRGLLKLEGGVEKSGLHFYRFNDIHPQLYILSNEVFRASQLDASHRNAFDRSVLQLNNAYFLYFRLKNTLQPEDTQDFAKELDTYLDLATKARAEVMARQEKGEKMDEETFDRLLGPIQKIAQRYQYMSRMDNPLIVPPETGPGGKPEWRRMGDALLSAPAEGTPQSIRLLAGMATAYRSGEAAKFNQQLTDYRALLAKGNLGKAIDKAANETFFNKLLAFKRSMYIYITAFLLILLYWAGLNNLWRLTAVRLLWVGFIVHTAGLIFRMWLEGRPPVTNLYSSAIFIGWGAVVLGLVLEKFFKDGIGTAVATCIGFLSLIVAHNLAQGGDTMEMMRAVLDTNFWLATHVVVITLGYASTFVAGFLAVLYVVLGVFTKNLTSPMSGTSARVAGTAAALLVKTDGSSSKTLQNISAAAERGELGKSLTRMVYGIVCFSTLFSFVGTVLGGIWADQSWGRFWGWDPKENGALIIVLWNVLILHARWGGLIKERGLMNCAIVGNIVTSWSWFGVNMLGIGLHSYGFMDAAFMWLMLFVGSQLLLVALGSIPLSKWRSFRIVGAN